MASWITLRATAIVTIGLASVLTAACGCGTTPGAACRTIANPRWHCEPAL